MASTSEKRTPAQREQDLSTVAGYLVRGLSGRAIATLTHRPEATVRRDVKLVFKRWHEDQKLKISEVIARELAKLDERERLIMEAIQRDLGERVWTTEHRHAIAFPSDDAERFLIEKSGIKDAKMKRGIIPIEIKTSKRTAWGNVNPGYFTALDQVWIRRAQLLGYDRGQTGGEMPDVMVFVRALQTSTASLWDDPSLNSDDDADDDFGDDEDD